MLDLIQEHIRSVLRANNEHDEAMKAAVRDLEAKGYRIVSGGQIGIDVWEITDHRTGELLGRGEGIASYEEAFDRPKEDGRPWCHYDVIGEDLFEAVPHTDGLPESLCDVLTEWVNDRATDEEIAFVAGLAPDGPGPEL